MPEYDHEDLTINPTQVFSVHNWALKPNQPKEPPFTDHMKAICNMDVLVESPNPTTSSKTEMKVPQGKILELEVDSEDNNLENTYLSPKLRHPNPKLDNQIKKLCPVQPRKDSMVVIVF
ncbi:hypothetical protein Tco_0973290 [Tanacetum coccineum]